MNVEHTFPLPEVETQKLDHLRAELSAHDGAAPAVGRWVRENPITATVAALVLGFVLVRCLKS